MKRMLLVVDSLRYIKKNCYQSQLYETLKKNFKVKVVDAQKIERGLDIDMRKFDVRLSVLRLRSLQRMIDPLDTFFKSSEIFIYDQDPWESYMDGSPFKGTYKLITDRLNVRSFLNTSKWWSDYIRQQGHPSTFVRMGMLPKLCKLGKPWEKRRIHLGFQGSLHEHRKVFFDALEAEGCEVTYLPSAPYKKFLKNLHDIRIYIHTEDAPWTVNGQTMPRNALWIKDTEAAARGCFSIRDHEDECHAYDTDELQTIFTYHDVSEVPGLIRKIENMSAEEKNQRMAHAVETMRKRDDWMTVVNAIHEGSS